MAITFVGGVIGTEDNGTDVTLDLTSLTGGAATSPSEDDIVIVLGSATQSVLDVVTSGYDRWIKVTNSSSGVLVEAKVMGASPDTQVVGNNVGSGDWPATYAALVYRGVDLTTPQDTAAISATGSGTSPNSGSITTVTDGARVLSAVGGFQSALEIIVNSGPSGYGNVFSDTAVDGSLYAWLGGADKEVTSAGAEDPGAWALSNSSPWAAATIALRPFVEETDDELTALDITSGTPTIDAPTLGVVHNLTAQDITAGTPTIDQATLGVVHNLTSQDVLSGAPTIDAATIGQEHALTAQDITSGTPTIDQATLGVVHPLTALDIASGAPTIDAASLGQEHALTAQDILSGTPTIDAATLGVVHPLTALDILSGTPIIDAATIAQVHALTSQDILSGTPVIDAASLTESVGLTAQDILAGAPFIDAATIAQVHALTAQDIVSGIPFIDAANLNGAEDDPSGGDWYIFARRRGRR